MSAPAARDNEEGAEGSYFPMAHNLMEAENQQPWLSMDSSAHTPDSHEVCQCNLRFRQIYSSNANNVNTAKRIGYMNPPLQETERKLPTDSITLYYPLQLTRQTLQPRHTLPYHSLH